MRVARSYLEEGFFFSSRRRHTRSKRDWSSDVCSSDLAFHRNLRNGDAKDEALRRAMESVRKDPRSSHPYYWAAFYLTGDPDNPSLGNQAYRPELQAAAH